MCEGMALQSHHLTHDAICHFYRSDENKHVKK